MSERTDTDERAIRIEQLEYELELANVALASYARLTNRLEAERARVLALLESGYFGKALDLLHGKGD